MQTKQTLQYIQKLLKNEWMFVFNSAIQDSKNYLKNYLRDSSQDTIDEKSWVYDRQTKKAVRLVGENLQRLEQHKEPDERHAYIFEIMNEGKFREIVNQRRKSLAYEGEVDADDWEYCPSGRHR